MVLSAQFARDEDLIRFRLEGEMAARVQHPNIVQIHEVGASHGRPFMALEYVGGGTLAKQMRDQPWPPRRAAQLLETLARAVHAAHCQGIIHRDLKPANILLTADGVPKITDFGLARHIDHASGLTETGCILGTPDYMAPEQATGDRRATGPATDVYALGAILYELLAGESPFRSDAKVITVIQLLTREPRRFDAGRLPVPRDLETICLKCLEKEPARRYATAEALAEDLRRFLGGEPIRARPVGRWERTWKWARRRPEVAALVLGMILVTLLGFAGVTGALIYALRGWNEAEAAQGKEARQRHKADQAREEAETNVYFSQIAQSRLEWGLHNAAGASRLLDQCRPERRGWEWGYLKGLQHAALLCIEDAHEAYVNSVAFSPDGRCFASSGGDPFVAPQDNYPTAVKVWDVQGRLLHTLTGFREIAGQVRFSRNGKWLAAESQDGRLRVWDTSTWELRHTLGGDHDDLHGSDFHPDGRTLTATGRDRKWHAWDLFSGQEVRLWQEPMGSTDWVAYNPEGHIVALVGDDIQLCEVDSGRLICRFGRNGERPIFSPDGRLLALITGPAVQLWNVADGQLLHSLNRHVGKVTSVAFSPDGRFVATSGVDTTVRLWEVSSGSEIAVWPGHDGRISCMSFHPSGHLLVTGSQQPGDIKIWDLTRPLDHRIAVDSAATYLEALCFTESGRDVAVLNNSGSLEIQDATTGRQQRQHLVSMNDTWICPAALGAFSADGRWLAAVSAEDRGLVRMWDVATGQPSGEAFRLGVSVWQVALAGNRWIACAGLEQRGKETAGACRLWDRKTGKELFKQETVNERHFSLALAPSGDQIAEGVTLVAPVQTANDWTFKPLRTEIRLWDVPASSNGETIAPARILQTLDASVFALAFSPWGRMLAAASDEGQIFLWDSSTGRLLHDQPLASPPGIQALAFSPDGRLLAAVNREQVNVWDVRTGQEVLILRSAPPRTADIGFNPKVAWSPDGQRLAASNWEVGVCVWDAAERNTPASKVALGQEAGECAYAWHVRNATAALDERNEFALRFHWGHLLEHDPPEPRLLLERGVLYARLKQWDKASDDYTYAFSQLRPGSIDHWRRQAYFRLRAGDREAYRLTCARMIEQFGHTHSPYAALDLVSACTAAAQPGVDYAGLEQMLQRRVLQRPDIRGLHYGVGMAAYRAGHFELARKELLVSLEDANRNPMPLNWILLALTSQQLGQADEASKWLEKTRQWYDQEAPNQQPREGTLLPHASLDWTDWLQLQLLLHEAEANVMSRP
jgi:WD40 repeat protein